jgi:hypothetical protein
MRRKKTKKPKKPKKTKKKQKNPLGWFFFKNPGFFQPCTRGILCSEFGKYCLIQSHQADLMFCLENTVKYSPTRQILRSELRK